MFGVSSAGAPATITCAAGINYSVRFYSDRPSKQLLIGLEPMPVSKVREWQGLVVRQRV